MSSVQSYSVHAIISNIPKKYHCYQLRNFFASFLETGGFVCFHYIHRREVDQHLNSTDSDKQKSVSNCCIVKVVADRVHELIETYNLQYWLGDNGEILPTCCFVKEIKLSHNGRSIRGDCKWAIPKILPGDCGEFSSREVKSFPEMRPPWHLPNGNVGTPANLVLKEIQLCRLPPRVIDKLGLLLPGSGARKISNGPAFDFKTMKDKQKRKRNLKKNILNSKQFLTPSFHKRYWHSESPNEFSDWEDKDYREINRFPDAPVKERYFGARIADCDMDNLFKKEPGMYNLRDLKERPINSTGADIRFEFAAFEKYNKGIGSKILENQGWKKGEGIGKNANGIAEPLPNEGQFNKRGFGYQVVKLGHHPPKEERTMSDDPNISSLPESGIGRRILETQGWNQGQGVAKNAAGVAEPQPSEGQFPSNKKEFGYHGVKLDRHPPREEISHRHPDFEDKESAVYISTINDDTKLLDPPESVLEPSSYAWLKYWQEI